MDFAVILGLVFFILACALGIIVSTVVFYRRFSQPRVPAVPPPLDTMSDPSLVLQARVDELEVELKRRRESHEEVVRVLINERDQWRDMHEKLSGQFSETEVFYADKLEEVSILAARNVSKADKETTERLKKQLAAHRAMSELPRTRVTKEADGTSVLDGEGAPEPVAAFAERMA